MGFTLGGLVAGEGSFYESRRLPPYADGSPRRRFVFSLKMADRDEGLVRALHTFLGAGSVGREHRNPDRWSPTIRLDIGSNRQHLQSTIPFADRFLLPSAKRDQYSRWRADLLAHLDRHPTRYGAGRAPCSICGRPSRARGLCRRHYYEATGN